MLYVPSTLLNTGGIRSSWSYTSSTLKGSFLSNVMAFLQGKALQERNDSSRARPARSQSAAVGGQPDRRQGLSQGDWENCLTRGPLLAQTNKDVPPPSGQQPCLLSALHSPVP